LPREPEKLTLRGHKSKVTKISMHPVYSDVASASDDGSIKLWDYE
jgi:platelet-activating factor acetylhydrolase IB subunit alpha